MTGYTFAGTFPSSNYGNITSISNNTNAGLTGSLQYIQDGLGTQGPFQLSTTTVNFTGTVQVGGYTMTFPAATSTVVTLAASQTLTNKTLTSPTINSATMTAPALGTPASGDLSNCTNVPVGGTWTDFSGTVTYTGFSGTPTTYYARYMKIGKTVYINIGVSGTSSSTGFSITNLPFTSGAVDTYVPLAPGVNAGGAIAATFYGFISNGSTSMSVNNSAGWANSGTKGIFTNFFYETT